MTLSPARIEAAARAVVETAVIAIGDWDVMNPEEVARAVLAAAIPELANGTAWIAPVEATESTMYLMWKYSLLGPEDARDLWSAISTHLKEDNPGGKEKDAG